MPRFCFVMEQTLGHVTHCQNLQYWTQKESDIQADWLLIRPEGSDPWERFPVIRGNWSLKGSLRARDALRAQYAQAAPDALFLHTQTVALCSAPFMRQTPSIISLDATPLNYDAVGEAYGHRPSNNLLEKQKFKWHAGLFQQAQALVTWCQWAKDSLVNDYGVPARKVQVIPPGIDMARWDFGSERALSPIPEKRRLRLLFVGGDFERKGGAYLLEAFRTGLQESCQLDIVTKERPSDADIEGVRVHCGLTANSEPLKRLFAQADLFVFPTLADCLPIAVMEAMAAGLPVIATGIAALGEEVEDETNGLLIPPKSVEALVEATRRLLRDPDLRQNMGIASRRLAEERFDAKTNYHALLGKMRDMAALGTGGATS